MAAPIDALLAELAAAELECRENARACNAAERTHGADSLELVLARRPLLRAVERRTKAVAALTGYALTWAAERAQSFVTPANDTPDAKLAAAIDDAFAPLRGMR